MLWLFAQVIAGLAVLTLAADRFVVAAARLAKSWGVSPILIGALILGMGTSTPEVLVGALAAARGELDAAVGAVIGSNVANVSLVLGTTAAFWPIAGALRTIRREGILMFGGVVAFAVVVWNGVLSRPEGVGLLLGMVVAGWLILRWARTDSEAGLIEHIDLDDAPLRHARFGVMGELLVALGTLVATLGGAWIFLNGAFGLAEEFGVSAGLVGLTLLAIGTSLPELATGIAAARRRQNNLVIGNVLGSNLFNSLAVAGIAALVGPAVLVDNFTTELLFMIGVAAVAGLLSGTGNVLTRGEGIALLVSYGLFVVLL